MSTKERQQNWCFTLNNYTSKDVQDLKDLKEDKINYIVFGYEICPHTNTPHLQGYVEFVKQISMLSAKTTLFNNKLHKIHLEPRARSSKRLDNTLYCKKGEQSKEEWNYYKEKGLNYGKNAIFYEQIFKEFKQGQRNDLCEIHESIKEHKDFHKVLQEQPEWCIKYPHGVQNAINFEIDNENQLKLINKYKNCTLKTWQANLLKDLQKEPDDRTIIWYYDQAGKAGKNFIIRYIKIQYNNKVCYLSNGKTADLNYAWNGEEIVLVNLTRTIEDKINYGAIEGIKDGHIFSPKYMSKSKLYPSPHLVIMANFMPDIKAMTEDRWDIRIIKNDIILKYDVYTSSSSLLSQANSRDHSQDHSLNHSQEHFQEHCSDLHQQNCLDHSQECTKQNNDNIDELIIL